MKSVAGIAEEERMSDARNKAWRQYESEFFEIQPAPKEDFYAGWDAALREAEEIVQDSMPDGSIGIALLNVIRERLREVSA